MTFKASAATLLERGDVRHGYFSQEAILERGGMFHEFKEVFDKLGVVLTKIIDSIEWLNHIFENAQEVSIQFLSFIYETLSKIVLTTPTIIFNNPFIQNTTMTFSVISISLVTILTIFESLMQITKQKHTKFKDIIKRYFTAVTVTGFAPFLFEKGFNLINKLTVAVTKIGGNFATNGLLMANQHMSTLDVSIMLGFDIVLFAMLFPIFLQNGRRWWDLMCLAAVSPLAGTAYVFDRHRHHFNSWWRSVKHLSLIQLVYATFIMFMGVFIFGTQSISYGWMLIVKLVIVAGGMWRLLNPPRIVLALTSGDSKDVVDMYDDYKKGFLQVKDIVTFNKFRPVVAIKNSMNKKKDNLIKLRKEHGQRSVSHLMKK